MKQVIKVGFPSRKYTNINTHDIMAVWLHTVTFFFITFTYTMFVEHAVNTNSRQDKKQR